MTRRTTPQAYTAHTPRTAARRLPRPLAVLVLAALCAGTATGTALADTPAAEPAPACGTAAPQPAPACDEDEGPVVTPDANGWQ
ncbi:hypothetical protein ACL02R_28090 [Streptomyces sp. MS19]|uniref:hypothetical protein n=1 Tax=Streptomyces sp. MS19 TaxID=3385972 RepID=UPI0039A231EB